MYSKALFMRKQTHHSPPTTHAEPLLWQILMVHAGDNMNRITAGSSSWIICWMLPETQENRITRAVWSLCATLAPTLHLLPVLAVWSSWSLWMVKSTSWKRLLPQKIRCFRKPPHTLLFPRSCVYLLLFGCVMDNRTNILCIYPIWIECF